MNRIHKRLFTTIFLLFFLAACTGRMRTLSNGAGVTSLAWSPDGKMLASGASDGTILIWDVTSDKQLQMLKTPSPVNGLAWSPDSMRLASGSWSALQESTVYLWDVSTGKKLETFWQPTPDLWSMAWSPNGQTLAIGAGGNSVFLWNVISGDVQTLRGHTGKILSLDWSPDGLMLATGSQDGTVKLWDTDSDEQVLSWAGYNHDYISAVAWSPDGLLLAISSCSNRDDVTEPCLVSMWNPDNGEVLYTLKGDSHLPTSIAWSPNGHLLASGSWEGAIILWNIDTRQRFNTRQGDIGLRAVVWSPDDQILASGSENGTITYWKVTH